jgi:hypothetical protein
MYGVLVLTANLLPAPSLFNSLKHALEDHHHKAIYNLCIHMKSAFVMCHGQRHIRDI